jgi:hypothetical protein
MLDIRAALQANILPAAVSTTDLYYDVADQDATPPYIVYSFEPINTQDESSDAFFLNIEGWDTPTDGDTTELENLMKAIDGNGDIKAPTGLNEKVISTSAITMILRRENRLSIIDSDVTVKRRRYQYLVTSFEKEG